MEKTKILIAENERVRRVKEILDLSYFVEGLTAYDKIPMSKAGYGFNAGIDPDQASVNLTKISQEISLAFAVHILPDGPGQQYIRMSNKDAITIQMLNDLLDDLDGETDRSCSYICEMVMAFPEWIRKRWNMPMRVTTKGIQHGSFGTKKITDETKTSDDEKRVIRVADSNILLDRIFIPDENNPEKKTISEFSLRKRYSDGLVGKTLQKLMKELEETNFHYFVKE